MSSLKYTVLAGDTMTSIADGVNAATGVTYQQIEAANPNMPANALQVGAVIDIPAPAGGTAMRYTVMAGDSYSAIATNINDPWWQQKKINERNIQIFFLAPFS